ncbi:MAG TPA: fructose PTS transporter subunit IIA, partial [Arthrobacter sp.]|nr:fructose PTS transporter subunit IIA [Arthrobacter sp.]
MTQLITTELVELDQNLGSTPEDVIRHMAGKVAANGRATEVEGLFADAFAREQKTATGVPGGIAIPHCRSTAVTEPTLVMARLSQPVDFGAKDGPADLIFFIAAPEGADQEHLKLLSRLARSLIKKDFTASLRAAGSEAEVVELVEGALADKPAAAAPAAGAAAAAGSTEADSTAEPAPAGAPRPKRLVAVTACPTGIAHTYMAADSLVAAAKEAGIDLQVETQGSSGAKPLDPAVIAAADAVIFAVDVDVRGKERFAGMPVINAPVKRGIDEPGKMVQEAL